MAVRWVFYFLAGWPVAARLGQNPGYFEKAENVFSRGGAWGTEPRLIRRMSVIF
jgi:hypothetical protein